jgi:phage terminase small subunit
VGGDMAELPAKQQAFVREYLIDLNATQAAIRAGYSAKTAEQQGCRLLRNVQIATQLQKAMDGRAKRVELTADRVLQEIQKMAFFDPRKLFNDAGEPIHITQLDDDTAAAVAGLDIVMQGNQDVGYAQVLKVKLSDKRASLELLGRHLKLFSDRTEVHHTGLADVLASLGGSSLKPVDETD